MHIQKYPTTSHIADELRRLREENNRLKMENAVLRRLGEASNAPASLRPIPAGTPPIEPAQADSETNASEVMGPLIHELRTAVAGIFNMAGLIQEDHDRFCTHDNIRLILESCRHLKNSLQDLKAALRPESNAARGLEPTGTEPPRCRATDSPDAAAARNQSGASPTSLAQLGPLRILVVEDNFINQLSFQQMLEQQGFSVQSAANGKQALDWIVREAFDVVLMDVKMPVMDGLEATRRIRSSEDPRIRGTKIIALTAYAMAEDRRRILAAGVDEMISKPVEKDQLAEILTRVLKPGA